MLHILQHLGVGKWDDFNWNARFELRIDVGEAVRLDEKLTFVPKYSTFFR